MASRSVLARSVVVVGGGLAGVAAATLLVEQGVPVTILEQAPWLGGRMASWTDRLRDGTLFRMDRGLMAISRQARNVRSLVRRVDPELARLAPLDGPPRRALIPRAPGLRLRDLARSDLRRARMMFAFDPEETYRDLEGTSARRFLEELGLPPPSRHTLFDTFARGSFDPPEQMCAAELLGSIHHHYAQGPDGVVSDTLRDPPEDALWAPLSARLTGGGATVRTRSEVLGIDRTESGWRVRYRSRGVTVAAPADAVVLAANVPGLKLIVASSPDLAPLAAGVASLGVTLPYAVLRLWLDAPPSAERPVRAGVSGAGLLDAIAVLDRIESESASWAQARGGSVLELTARALPETMGQGAIRQHLLSQLYATYPETRRAKLVDDRLLVKRDAPSFAPGSQRTRPGVVTDLSGVVLAGDFVRLPFPTGPMERAAASGFLAANQILAGWGKPTSPVAHGNPRGVLSRTRRD
jgi:isorenieratene synthase